jgi:ABC-2 type transport system permease protein
MVGVMPVFRKELADHFSSRRFLMMLAIIVITGLGSTYVAAQTIRGAVTEIDRAGFVFLRLFTVSGESLAPFLSFIGFLGPLVGLALGFDAINSEFNRGTMSRVLAQPIYRDSLINGKFAAGLTTIAIMIGATMVLVAGLGLRNIGVPPSGDELARLVLFYVLTVMYVAFWMSLSILFSILFRQAATSALAGFGVWIVTSFFVLMFAGLFANALVPLNPQSPPEDQARNENTRQLLARVAPQTLYQEATVAVLTPRVYELAIRGGYGMLLPEDVVRLVDSPLSLLQSLLLVWPQAVGLLALTALCFAASYVKFMRQEIRAP